MQSNSSLGRNILAQNSAQNHLNHQLPHLVLHVFSVVDIIGAEIVHWRIRYAMLAANKVTRLDTFDVNDQIPSSVNSHTKSLKLTVPQTIANMSSPESMTCKWRCSSIRHPTSQSFHEKDCEQRIRWFSATNGKFPMCQAVQRPGRIRRNFCVVSSAQPFWQQLDRHFQPMVAANISNLSRCQHHPSQWFNIRNQGKIPKIIFASALKQRHR